MQTSHPRVLALENVLGLGSTNDRRLLSSIAMESAIAQPPQCAAAAAASQSPAAAKKCPRATAKHQGTPGIANIVIPSSQPKTDGSNVLGLPLKDVRSAYALGKELGRGQFGITYACTDKITGEKLACKTISKRSLRNRTDMEDVQREMQIMQRLAGQHANIVELKAVYEDKQSVHLVMELCAGGELFDRIVSRGHYTEKAAAAVFRTIVRIVQHCHATGVIHRDLKPENFLLASPAEDAPLKATDFGLSVFYKTGQIFTETVGSAYYVAPEVLKKRYGPEADIWSAGVILYILLCGLPPFWAETEKGIFDSVLRGELDFSDDPWPKISSSAKELIRRMLNQNPSERLAIPEILDHPWVRPDGEASDQPLDQSVLARMKGFTAMNKMKKIALKIIAESLSEKEIKGLKELFKKMDVDKSGTITFEELKSGLAKQGYDMAESEVRAIMESADVDGNGTIDYLEFISATMHMNKMDRENNLLAAFKQFDTDNSGFISVEELEQALYRYGMVDEGMIKDIIKEVDVNKDGRIDYNEFATMMLRAGSSAEEGERHRHRHRHHHHSDIVSSSLLWRRKKLG
ncbi:calcium-dependent protein kinase 2 [Selaginella moellendorffii]|uniref:calcium-dependent protein kinase 2 n=1 Tax=Selaginella moellendorffii TaxID=88036 RepID=UPI000D1CBB78|nr:calcium-dependent protein kinase 2 [Selaginella moellendorffii]|eukprot:XP_024529122.1 calcium-dependent protein kinase 2 [Selaginella moellendorffii]